GRFVADLAVCLGGDHLVLATPFGRGSRIVESERLEHRWALQNEQRRMPTGHVESARQRYDLLAPFSRGTPFELRNLGRRKQPGHERIADGRGGAQLERKALLVLATAHGSS